MDIFKFYDKIKIKNELREPESCSHCQTKDFVKRGVRKNKLEIVQLYLCKNSECGKTFTAKEVKGKHFPLNIVIEALSYYNLGFNFQQTCSLVRQKFFGWKNHGRNFTNRHRKSVKFYPL